MPAVIPLVIAGVSAASGVYAAKKAASTAKNASQIQVDASNQAMNYQRDASNKAIDYINASRNAPLQPMQGGSVNYLQQLMGVPRQQTGAPQAMPQAPGQPKMGMLGTPPPAAPQAAGYGQLMGAASPMGATAPPTGAPSGGMVMLEAPTGERRAVPEAQAQALIARGARRVG